MVPSDFFGVLLRFASGANVVLHLIVSGYLAPVLGNVVCPFFRLSVPNYDFVQVCRRERGISTFYFSPFGGGDCYRCVRRRYVRREF